MNRSANASHTGDTCQAPRMRGAESPRNQIAESDPTLLRLSELEIENRRLQHLVAELLIKNQRLRVEVEAAVEFLTKQE